MTLESYVLSELLRQAGNHLWQSTIFAVVAFLLTLALRSTHARARHWILLVASLKFLVPFALLAELGDLLGSRVVPAAPAAHIPLVVGQVMQPFALPEPVVPTLVAAPTHDLAFTIHAVVFVCWLAGFAAVLFHWWDRWRRARAVVRAAVPLREGRAVDALRRVRSKGVLRLPDIRLVSSTARMEPGIFGIFRPVLWLPDRIADHLSDTELEAILAHELCHARRRDNLAAAFHMVVEAVFWFHPLVWWLGVRMVEERERA
ncbi:MAG: M56 family metallopeptidase, partial [Bryobacteraceae bacterium]